MDREAPLVLLPSRTSPQASIAEIDSWVVGKKTHFIVNELLKERAYNKLLEKNGKWATNAATTEQPR